MQEHSRDKDHRTAPAAEADVLGEAARNSGSMDGLAPDRDDKSRTTGTDERGEAQPGQDENQAGFVKDPDKKFSP